MLLSLQWYVASRTIMHMISTVLTINLRCGCATSERPMKSYAQGVEDWVQTSLRLLIICGAFSSSQLGWLGSKAKLPFDRVHDTETLVIASPMSPLTRLAAIGNKRASCTASQFAFKVKCYALRTTRRLWSIHMHWNIPGDLHR